MLDGTIKGLEPVIDAVDDDVHVAVQKAYLSKVLGLGAKGLGPLLVLRAIVLQCAVEPWALNASQVEVQVNHRVYKEHLKGSTVADILNDSSLGCSLNLTQQHLGLRWLELHLPHGFLDCFRVFVEDSKTRLLCSLACCHELVIVCATLRRPGGLPLHASPASAGHEKAEVLAQRLALLRLLTGRGGEHTHSAKLSVDAGDRVLYLKRDGLADAGAAQELPGLPGEGLIRALIFLRKARRLQRGQSETDLGRRSIAWLSNKHERVSGEHLLHGGKAGRHVGEGRGRARCGPQATRGTRQLAWLARREAKFTGRTPSVASARSIAS
mmetsp:Transcript_14068/g.27324  ORF Transcript_14068/g.27324 Transcript_14068/m.27324 type:complete len:325 (-) Transcript_14068:49-1023(-)